MGFFEITPIFVILYIFFRYLVPYLWRITHRRAIDNRQPKVDYGRIAELEREIYGQNFTCDGAPPNWDATWPKILAEKERRDKEAAEKLLQHQAEWNYHRRDPSPMPTYPGDPNWTDEDGRPW